MKNIVVVALIIIVSVSNVFNGLFFDFDASVFFTVLAVLSAVYFLVKQRNKETLVYNKWIAILSILLLTAYSISFIRAADVRENIGILMQYSQYFILLIILYDYYYESKNKLTTNIMYCIVCVGLICAVIGIEALTGTFDFMKATVTNNRIGSTFQYANTASIFFVVCLLFVLTLINLTGSFIIRLALAGIGNILLIASLLTGSRGGIIVGGVIVLVLMIIVPLEYKFRTAAIFMCMFVPVLLFIQKFTILCGTGDNASVTKWILICFLTAGSAYLILELFYIRVSDIKIKASHKITAFAVFFLITIVIIVICRNRIVEMLPNNLVRRFLNFNLTNGSIVHRLEFYRDALKLISENWLFGLGGGGWTSLYQSVQERFYIARLVHNHFFQVFVEAGVVGFLAFTSITFISLRNILYSFKYAANQKEYVLICGIFCGFLSLVIHAAIDFDLSFPSISLLFWLLITVCNLYLTSTYSIKILSFNKVVIFVVISSLLAGSGVLYTTASYNGYKAKKKLDAGDYVSAAAYYEEAYRLDSLNAKYTFELTRLYKYFARKSKNLKDVPVWKMKVLMVAERSVSLDRYYPDYIYMLAVTYLDYNMPVKGMETAEQLIKCQPCRSENYELLARGYLDAAVYFADRQNLGRAKELADLCLRVDSLPFAPKSLLMNEYKKKAGMILNNNGG